VNQQAPPPTCALGVAPEDVGAWLLDGEPLPPPADAAHASSCQACRQTMVEMGSTREVADRLREPVTAPAETVSRVLHRVRLEILVGEVLTAFIDGTATAIRGIASTDDTQEEPDGV
jgi:hypothetical protein